MLVLCKLRYTDVCVYNTVCACVYMQLQLATIKVYIGRGYTWVCIMSVLEITFEDVISTTV